MDKAESGISKTESMRLMAEIRLYIQNNLKTATLNNAAANFNYSSAYLSRLIKNKTSVTFSEILRNERIAKACILLINTDMSIEQITLAVGYTTHRQFNRVFKEIVSMSPLNTDKSTTLRITSIGVKRVKGSTNNQKINRVL